MPIMTIRLTPQESARVARLAKRKAVTRSQVMREGLAALESTETRSAWDAWKDVAGLARGGARDLSSNPRHLKGYGQ